MDGGPINGWLGCHSTEKVTIIIIFNITINKTEVNVHIISIESSLHHTTD